MSAVAAVSWALIGMGGTAALGLHLLRADSAGSLGPMTAAVVVLGAGGSVSPSGDVSAFGLKGAQAHTAVEITPLGVSLAGALLLSWFFLRSLRTAGVVIAPAELLARAGTVVALFVAMLGGLAWAGHDVITLDGAALGLGRLPGAGGGKGGGISVPGLGGLGDIGGLLPDRIGDLIHARAAVGFTVDTAATLLGGLAWSAGVLLIALLAARRTPLPRGWSVVHRAVRPAVSALVTVQLVAVVAGLAAAAYAALGDDHPRRIAGAALLGAPNGVWLGVSLGLFVPWTGRATGALGTLLPHPLEELLAPRSDRPVTLARLADLDGRVRLLAVAAALLMLLAGVLTAVRTPVPGGPRAGSRAGGARFVRQCAVRLALATALALPLLTLLTDVTANASLSVLGLDAFGAGVDLHGHLGTALLLGAAWGAGAGAAGAALARVCGVAGTGAAALATAAGAVEAAADKVARGSTPGPVEHAGDGPGPGPYRPRPPYRPPDPGTNPYLRRPGEGTREGPAERREQPEDARPEPGPPAGDDLSGAPTVAGPLGGAPSPPRPPRQGPGAGRGRHSPRSPDTWPPPPPPPPPPAPPDTPKGRGH